MTLTRVSGGILKQPIDVGIITATSLNASGIITAGTVQVGSATTIHTTGIDLGSGNVTSHNINSTGIITATSFVGPVTGNVTGNLTGNVTGNTSGTAGGLTGSPSITVADITASGNVSIAGTLTYEDVTNIDAVGVITARSGIDCDGNATFGANGSITSGSNFTLNGNALTVTGSSTVVGEFKKAGSPTIQVTDTSNSTDLQLRADATGGLVRTASNKPLLFGTNQTERLRIASDGKVGIATVTPRAKFDVRPGGHSGDGAITFTTGLGEVGSSNNAIQSINGAGSSLQPLGYRATEHIFATQASERLRITSDGYARLTTANARLEWTASSGSNPFIRSIGSGQQELEFNTGGAERLRITSTGKIGVGGAPAANWHSAASSNVIQVGSSVLFDYSSAQFDVGHNYYYDGSNYKFTSTGYAERITFSKSDGSIRFWSLGTGNADATAAVSEKVRISAAGKVGINQASPSAPLSFNTGTGQKIELYNSGANNEFGFGVEASELRISSGSGSFIGFRTGGYAGTERLRITAGGLVGVNVSPTQQKLTIDVDSSGTSQGSFDGINICNTNNTTNNGSAIIFGQTIAGNSNARIGVINSDRSGSSEDQDIFFGTLGGGSYGERLRITSTGEVITTKGTNISYAATAATISDNLVFESRNPIRQEPAANQFYDMKAFIPSKSGSVAMNATMYIKSGPYYFVFRVIDEDGTVVFTPVGSGGYDAYDNPSGQSGNVHSYRIYKWVCPNLKADKKYKLQMAASTAGGGTTYASAGQWMYCKDFRVYSKSPGMTYGSNIHILQDVDYGTSAANGGTAHDHMASNSNNSILNHYQNFTGTESKFMGWFTTRAYNRYLDIKFNLNYSMMWFAQAYGYLYGYGQACGSMISGYSYTGTQILNKVNHTFGSRGWYGSYRTSSGHLCLKFDHGGNGYTEGTLAIFFGGHNGAQVSGIQVIEYRQNDSTSNAFS